MADFITIIHTDDGGLASYTINESKDHYKAALIKCTSAATLPQEVVIDRRLDQAAASPVSDSVKHKLIHAIKQTEGPDEEIG
jgi:hypothetical protein